MCIFYSPPLLFSVATRYTPPSLLLFSSQVVADGYYSTMRGALHVTTQLDTASYFCGLILHHPPGVTAVLPYPNRCVVARGFNSTFKVLGSTSTLCTLPFLIVSPICFSLRRGHVVMADPNPVLLYQVRDYWRLLLTMHNMLLSIPHCVTSSSSHMRIVRTLFTTCPFACRGQYIIFLQFADQSP